MLLARLILRLTMFEGPVNETLLSEVWFSKRSLGEAVGTPTLP